MSTVFQYKNRFNLLRSKIEELSDLERGDIKNNVRNLMDVVASEAYTTMKNATPVRPDEDEEIYRHRLTAIDTYGKPSYVKNVSPNRSVRLYGSNLRDGWEIPRVDFVGSNKNGVRISASIRNIAEHAQMVLTGNYSKPTWNITSNVPLQGGRKALAFMRGRNTVFVRPEAISFPVKFKANTKVAEMGIPQEGRNIIESYTDRFKKAVEDSIIEKARVTFR